MTYATDLTIPEGACNVYDANTAIATGPANDGSLVAWRYVLWTGPDGTYEYYGWVVNDFLN